MIARVANVTPELIALLRSRNDDGTQELRVSLSALDDDDGWAAHVTRHDGTELSATERAHVEATLAAHAAEPPCPKCGGDRRPEARLGSGPSACWCPCVERD